MLHSSSLIGGPDDEKRLTLIRETGSPTGNRKAFKKVGQKDEGTLKRRHVSVEVPGKENGDGFKRKDSDRHRRQPRTG
jgi:hypothetical protein